MAALPYMTMYWGDYLADTLHLTTEQHGAYLLIMAAYWKRGKSIPPNQLPSISKLNERWIEVEPQLNEFFTFDELGYWQHNRIEAELEKARVKSAKASAAGKASARKRAENQLQSNERSADVKAELQPQPNPSESEPKVKAEADPAPLPKPESSSKEFKPVAKKTGAKKFKPPDWVPIEKWDAYVKSRRSMKKHPMTDDALALVIPAIEKTMKSGYALDEIFDALIANGWRTVKPKFMENINREEITRSGINPNAASDNAALVDELYGKATNDDVIEGELG